MALVYCAGHGYGQRCLGLIVSRRPLRMLLDWIENAGIITMLKYHPNLPVWAAGTVSIAGMLKTIFAVSNMAVMLASVVVFLIKKACKLYIQIVVTITCVCALKQGRLFRHSVRDVYPTVGICGERVRGIAICDNFFGRLHNIHITVFITDVAGLCFILCGWRYG